MSEEKKKDELPVDDPVKVEPIDAATRTILGAVPGMPSDNPKPETEEDEDDAKAKADAKAIADANEANIPMIFKELDLGPSVASRINKYLDRARKVYKSLKYKERLDTPKYLKRMKLKTTDPREIKAACLAWKKLFHMNEVPVPQCYKPPIGDSTYGWLAK